MDGDAAERLLDSGVETAGEDDDDDDGGEGEGEGGGVHGDAQMGFMHRQPLARAGMAATLGLLAATGDLGVSGGHGAEQQVGGEL